MSAARLHYVYDPFCAWCYGAAPLVQAAAERMPVLLYGAGMLTGARRAMGSAEWQAYVAPHMHRVTEHTGQPFDRRYLDDLLGDTTAAFDSAPPTAAILASGDAGRQMLAEQQIAMYREGRRIADHQVLIELAERIGLDRSAFEQALMQVDAHQLRNHFDSAQIMLQRIRGRGYPSMAIERDGRLEPVFISRYYQDVPAFVALLKEAR